MKYSNKYRWFVIDDLNRILAGNEYVSDAQDARSDLGGHAPGSRIVSRNYLQRIGIDPNNSAAWRQGLERLSNDIAEIQARTLS